PAVGSAVIAVMEQRNIKLLTQLAQEIQQRTRALRKLNAVDLLIGDAGRRMATDHMANMVFGHFVIGNIQYRVMVSAQLIQQRLPGTRFGAYFNADINLRLLVIAITVIEFGNRPLAD